MLPSEAWGQNWVEFTTSHSGPWPVFLSWENSLHKILAQPSALCPQPGEEGAQCLQNRAQTVWEGGLLMGPRFCWMGSSTSEPKALAPALCSDGGISQRDEH